MPDEWIDARLDALKYDMWRGISALIWAVNQGILALADLLDQLRRALIDNGFRPVIDSLAEGVLGVSRPVFTVGCMLLALALIFSPVGRMLQLINSRKLFGIILLTPAILGAGVAGAFFQDLEELRGNVGSLINQGVMEEIAPAFADLGHEDTGTGQTQNVCEVLPFNPANTTRNGASIAGAFLCATRGDVLDPANPAPSELPDEFARTFFELGFAEFAQADDADREAQIANAIEGTGRMAIGFALVCFALVEALTNVLWTLGLGTLFIAAVIIWLVGWFRPYEHMLSVLSYGVLQVFTSSWILSAMYGVALAGGLAVADTRNAPLVFAAGLGLLVFGLYLLSMTAGTIAAAIKAAWNGITGGGGGPSHSGGLRWAERQLQRATQLAGGATAAAYTGATRPLRAAGNAAASTAGSVAEGWGNVAEAKLAYDTARSAGNSRTYAAVYAGSSNRKLAKIGALANAMEKTSPEAERALFTASRHRGDQLSPAAVRAVKRDARKT